MSSSNASTHRRSHHGCTRCKRRRQKCDEAKPSCTRCIQAGDKCTYTIELKWGAMPRGGGRKKKVSPTIESQPVNDGHLTGSSLLAKLPVTSVNLTTTSSVPARQLELPTLLVSLNRELDDLPWLPPTGRLLLHHYLTKASRVTSCHLHIQMRICRLIIPMALQTPSLLYATMALSALHRSTLINGQSQDIGRDKLVSSLMASSINSLRNELQTVDGVSKYALLLTIRTLAVCEIHSGRANASSWRAHFNGARALLEPTAASLTGNSSDMDESHWLVNTWYESIESLTALTTRAGLLRGQMASFGPPALIRDETPGNEYLDIYTAYSTDLNVVFKEIGAAAWERQRIDAAGDEDTLLSTMDLDAEASWLESSIRSMKERLGFRICDLQVLTPEEMQEYEACNEAYQNTALIHLRRRVQRLSASDPLVQENVKSIVRCATKMRPTDGLSPWVMLTTPLFAAGCEAFGEDRDAIRGLLQNMFRLLGIRNIQTSLDILELKWAKGLSKEPESLLSPEDYDFIPY